MLRGVLKTKPRTHHTYVEQAALPGFLRALESYEGGLQVKLAVKLLVLTFVRATELTAAKWSEFDLEGREWRIPPERMKMRTLHIVPLSTQAVEVLNTLKKLNGQFEYVFPNKKSPRKSMSSNAMLYALYPFDFPAVFPQAGCGGCINYIALIHRASPDKIHTNPLEKHAIHTFI